MKKVLITGGSSGIGKAFAEKYASLGYQVTIVARHEEVLKNTVAILPKISDGEHGYLAIDIATESGLAHLVDHISFTEYHTLVNNAGVGAGFGFTDVPLPKLLAMIRLNCDAVIALSYAFLTKAHEGAELINIASVVSFIPYPALPAYSATKAFVLSLTESLAGTYRKKGIKILAVCPGPTDTNFFRAAGESAETAPKKSTLQTPESVVSESLRGLASGKIFIVTGIQNKFLAFCGRHLPIRLVLWVASR